MADDSIEGLLKNLKRTLDSDSREKAPERNVVESLVRDNSHDESIFVLRKKAKRDFDHKNLLKESVLTQVENEVTRFVVDFCSSDDGISYIKLLIAKAIEGHEEFLKRSLKDEISKKIQEVLAAK